jgi:hypothetical protein
VVQIAALKFKWSRLANLIVAACKETRDHFAAAHQTIGLEMSGRRPNQNANAISAAELSRLCRALSVGNAHASRLIMDAINAAARQER